jgi:hypothetical protein
MKQDRRLFRLGFQAEKARKETGLGASGRGERADPDLAFSVQEF